MSKTQVFHGEKATLEVTPSATGISVVLKYGTSVHPASGRTFFEAIDNLLQDTTPKKVKIDLYDQDIQPVVDEALATFRP